MQFGHLTWIQTPDPQVSAATRIEQAVEIAEVCEQNLFDTAWFSEQHFSNYGYSPNPIIIATAAARQTSRIRIGLAVAAIPLWHPIRLAEDLALLDILSQGRLDVGIGKGYQHHVFRGMGIDIEERQERYEEVLDSMLAAWSSDSLQLNGKFWQTDQAVNVLPKPLQQPHPPIWVAVTSEQGIREVAATDFHVFGSSNWVIGNQGAKDHELYIQQRRAVGKEDDRWTYALNRQLRVLEPHEDRDAAWADFRDRSLYTLRLARRLRWDSVTYDRGVLTAEPIDDEPTDEELRNRTLFGTPAEIVEEILRYRQELDVSMIITQADFGGEPHERVCRSLELFGTEVIPAVRSALKE